MHANFQNGEFEKLTLFATFPPLALRGVVIYFHIFGISIIIVQFVFLQIFRALALEWKI